MVDQKPWKGRARGSQTCRQQETDWGPQEQEVELRSEDAIWEIPARRGKALQSPDHAADFTTQHMKTLNLRQSSCLSLLIIILTPNNCY